MSLEFTTISVAAKDRIKQVTDAWKLEISDLSYANMFIWRYSHNIEFCIDDDVLYIKLCHREYPCFFFVPLCLDKERSLKEPLNLIENYCNTIGEPVRVKSATVFQKEKIENDCPNTYAFSSDEGRFDYIYNTRDLIDLKGKKFHGKRNHINKFISLYNYEYVKLKSEHVNECTELYMEWAEKKGVVGLDIEDEWRSLTEALNNFEDIGMQGGAIKVDGAIRAFSLGEQITDDMALIHIEKGNTDYDGIFTMMNQLFVQNQYSQTTFINREEDMGSEGLRRAKRSYRPVRMIEKYDLKKIGETRK